MYLLNEKKDISWLHSLFNVTLYNMLAFAIIKYFFLAISTPLVHNIEIYLIFLLLILPLPTSDQ